jgi:hypothetical protein
MMETNRDAQPVLCAQAVPPEREAYLSLLDIGKISFGLGGVPGLRFYSNPQPAVVSMRNDGCADGGLCPALRPFPANQKGNYNGQE